MPNLPPLSKRQATPVAALGRWFARGCLLACILSMVGCPSPSPYPDGAGDLTDSAGNLARLDAACWYLHITRVPSSSSSTGNLVSIHGKVNLGTISDIAVYSQGESLDIAMAAVIRHIEAAVPAGSNSIKQASTGGNMHYALRDFEKLHVICFETKLNKNRGWSVDSYSIRPDQLVGKHEHIERETLSDALRESLARMMN